MLKKFFIFSEKDCFSKIIFFELKSKLAFELIKEQSEEGIEFYISKKYKDCFFLYFQNLHLFFDVEKDKILDQKDSVYFFISKHKSKEGEPYFTVHYTGNYLGADYGGKDNTLSIAQPEIKDYFFENYNKNIKHFMEVTHHGPLFLRPHIYIEVGPDNVSWNNKELIQKYIAWIKPLFSAKMEFKNKQGAVLIGGSHYFGFEEIQNIESKAGASIGHIIPKYVLTQIENNSLLEKLIQEAILKTPNCKKIIINKSYVAKYTNLLAVVNKINIKNEYEIIITL